MLNMYWKCNLNFVYCNPLLICFNVFFVFCFEKLEIDLNTWCCFINVRWQSLVTSSVHWRFHFDVQFRFIKPKLHFLRHKCPISRLRDISAIFGLAIKLTLCGWVSNCALGNGSWYVAKITLVEIVNFIHKYVYHCEFLEYWNTQKSVWRIWQRFSCLLDEGIPKIWRNWILTVAFWATCTIAEPIQPIWQHIFALP